MLGDARSALEEAYGEAEQEIDAVRGDINLLKFMVEAPPDPYEGLSNADLEKMNLLRPLIKEDCEELPVDELATAINAARLREADKMRLDLYQRYGERRRRAELDAMKRGDRQADPNHATKYQQLANALDRFPKPDVSGELAKVEELDSAAMEAKQFAWQTYQDTTGEAQRQLDAYYASIDGAKTGGLAGAVPGGWIN